ncbi:MAG: hypothetical protein C5S47_01455 [Candidatus Methanogasteraceae archaeon]|nr:MAG: hypothetical protein C5S47_01455 [ANME-2 cluster archaeon]
MYNLATANGTDPNGYPVTDTDSETVTLSQNPLINITKTGVFNDENNDGYADVGETITYTYDVENTGNVVLTNVQITDMTSGHGTLGSIMCAPLQGTTLNISGAMSCSADYTVDQADIDAGSVYNLATANGTDPNGYPVTDTDSETVTLPQNPSIDVEKYVSVDGGESWEDADELTGPFICNAGPQFKFVVTNTGNVNLTGITLTDSDFDLSGCTVPPLAVGESFDCFVTDTWVVVQHTNTANVTVDFGGQAYSDTDDANYYYRAPSSP